jgi:hypothetical protein
LEDVEVLGADLGADLGVDLGMDMGVDLAIIKLHSQNSSKIKKYPIHQMDMWDGEVIIERERDGKESVEVGKKVKSTKEEDTNIDLDRTLQGHPRPHRMALNLNPILSRISN